MEEYEQYCDEECKKRAKYYDEIEEIYYCELHFMKNEQPESAIRLITPSEVEDDVNLLEKGLKTFLIFVKENYKTKSQPRMKKIYKKLSKDLDKLSKQISKAEDKHQNYLFTKYKKQAKLIKEAIEDEIDFNEFTNNFFWSLLKEEARTPTSSEFIYDVYTKLDEVDLHQEEFIRKNALIKKLKKKIKELKEEICRLHSSATETDSETDSSASSEPSEPTLQEEMSIDQECRKFVVKMKKKERATFRLNEEMHKKVFGLVDQEFLENFEKISVCRCKEISPDEFFTFASKISHGLKDFNFSLGDHTSSVKITAYLPSILLLKSKIKEKISFYDCIMTFKEKAQIEKTFAGIEVEYNYVQVVED
ncbi:unnamed protein product [Moneuplotes crassus]|uniref:Uncharacterized protein n=1 Tax=Euplotes crassus TaxID=5936 RepID=A0AAD1U1U2_EUPCR|nr:unnamed protein product [Moneuplotes crassus]